MKHKKLNHKHTYFPPALKSIRPKITLNYLGKIMPQDTKSVVIIGTRECTRYGSKVTRALVKKLVEKDITIISGLAYGIDSCAQRSALDYGGRTIGFLGYGLSNINRHSMSGAPLATEIIKNNVGAVISPFNATQKPTKESYIYRNYIMAAFSTAVVVVEAGEHSGTFHTVNAALSYGKDVFAVPGSVFSPKSIGTHKLLKEGARVLQDHRDILDLMI